MSPKTLAIRRGIWGGGFTPWTLNDLFRSNSQKPKCYGFMQQKRVVLIFNHEQKSTVQIQESPERIKVESKKKKLHPTRCLMVMYLGSCWLVQTQRWPWASRCSRHHTRSFTQQLFKGNVAYPGIIHFICAVYCTNFFRWLCQAEQETPKRREWEQYEERLKTERQLRIKEDLMVDPDYLQES